MSKKPVNDPLESAKVSKDAPKKTGWGKRKEKKEAAASVEETAVETSTPEPEPLAPVPAPVKNVGTPPGITKLKVGTVISSQHYGGMAGIDRLKDCGVELEELA